MDAKMVAPAFKMVTKSLSKPGTALQFASARPSAPKVQVTRTTENITMNKEIIEDHMLHFLEHISEHESHAQVSVKTVCSNVGQWSHIERTEISQKI